MKSKVPLFSTIEKIFLAVFILWACGLFLHYFSWSSVTDFSFVRTILSDLRQATFFRFKSNAMEFFKALFFCFFALLTLWMWGRRLRLWLGLRMDNRALRMSADMALGMVLFNNLWLGTGLLGLWIDPLPFFVGLVALGFALLDFFDLILDKPPLGWTPPQGIPLKLLTLLAIAGLILSLSQGAVPAAYFDTLCYHLAALSFWQFHHGITDLSTNLYAHYPFGGEMFLMNGFYFQGGEGAKIMDVLSEGVLGLAAAGWVASEAGLPYGYLTVGLIIGLPMIPGTAWTAQVDLLLSLFLLLFFYSLSRWDKQKTDWRWAVAAGLMGGAALTVKYTAVLGLFVGLWVYGMNWTSKGWTKRWLVGGGLVKILILASAAPWLIKNFAFAGDPVYPYLSGFFHGRSLPSENLKELMTDHVAVWGGGEGYWKWLGLILTRDLDKTIAPILFCFLPLLFWFGKFKPATKKLLWLCLFYLILSFLVSHQLRLVLPAFVVGLVAMGLAAADLPRKPFTLAWTWVVVAFCALSLLSLGRLSTDYYQSQKIWEGVQLHSEYLSFSPLTYTYYSLTEDCAKLLSQDDQLLIAGDARGLYYRQPFIANSVFDEQVLVKLAKEEKDGDGIRWGLKKMGVDDLVVCSTEGARINRDYLFYRLNPAEWARLDDFIQRYTDLLVANEFGGVYRLRKKPVKRAAKIPDLLLLI